MSKIKAALNTVPADLLITNVRVANVFTSEIYPADIIIHDGAIVAVELPSSEPPRQTLRTIDGNGQLAVPGLIDSHMHIESSLLAPAPFAEAALRRGVTVVAEDPHEVANATGLDGIRAYWEASQGLPLRIFYLASTCVPATEDLETCQGVMGPNEIAEMLTWEGVIGLAEVMDARAVIDETEKMSGILDVGRRSGGLIEGHNPMLRGRELNAYIAAGVSSDHTLMTPDLLREKARLGVFLQLQERYLTSEIIDALLNLPMVTNFCLVTDDVSPDYLENHGHLDQVIRRAIDLGMPPMMALRAATISPARHLRLLDSGAIAPGYRADIVLIDAIETFNVSTTLVAGNVVVEDGESKWSPPEFASLDALRDSLSLSPVSPEVFSIKEPTADGIHTFRVIHSNNPGTTTNEVLVDVEVQGQIPQLDAFDDLCMIAVLARGGNDQFVGLLNGLGLQAGAVATSHAHDSHNLAVIGRDPGSMATAANAVIEAGGGIAVAVGDNVHAFMPLPLAGVVSDQPSDAAARQFRDIRAALSELGVEHPDLLMRISTYTLPVSTGLRITDRGLVEAVNRVHVPLIVTSQGNAV